MTNYTSEQVNKAFDLIKADLKGNGYDPEGEFSVDTVATDLFIYLENGNKPTARGEVALEYDFVTFGIISEVYKGRYLSVDSLVGIDDRKDAYVAFYETDSGDERTAIVTDGAWYAAQLARQEIDRMIRESEREALIDFS